MQCLFKGAVVKGSILRASDDAWVQAAGFENLKLLNPKPQTPNTKPQTLNPMLHPGAPNP